MNQVNKPRTISDLSKKELMDFIMTLNKCMQDYDNNIEYRIKCSEKVEWDSIKTIPVSAKGLKKIQYARNIKR